LGIQYASTVFLKVKQTAR